MRSSGQLWPTTYIDGRSAGQLWPWWYGSGDGLRHHRRAALDHVSVYESVGTSAVPWPITEGPLVRWRFSTGLVAADTGSHTNVYVTGVGYGSALDLQPITYGIWHDDTQSVSAATYAEPVEGATADGDSAITIATNDGRGYVTGTADIPMGSIAAWIKPSPTANASGYVPGEGLFLAKRYYLRAPDSYDARYMTPNMALGLTGGNFSFHGLVATGPSLLDGQWHHVAVTRSSVYPYSEYKVYVDGEMRVSGTPAFGYSTDIWEAGGMWKVGDLFAYVGGIDDVEIYRYALSDAAVAALYSLRRG